MKLTRKQLNKIKKFIKSNEQLQAVYAISAGLWYSDYYNCWNFEYIAETNRGMSYSDLMRFDAEELNKLIND